MPPLPNGQHISGLLQQLAPSTTSTFLSAPSLLDTLGYYLSLGSRGLCLNLVRLNLVPNCLLVASVISKNVTFDFSLPYPLVDKRGAQATAEESPETLAVLSLYRRRGGSVIFGQYCTVCR